MQSLEQMLFQTYSESFSKGVRNMRAQEMSILYISSLSLTMQVRTRMLGRRFHWQAQLAGDGVAHKEFGLMARACLEGDGVHGLVLDDALPQLSGARLLCFLVAHILRRRLQRLRAHLCWASLHCTHSSKHCKPQKY